MIITNASEITKSVAESMENLISLAYIQGGLYTSMYRDLLGTSYTLSGLAVLSGEIRCANTGWKWLLPKDLITHYYDREPKTDIFARLDSLGCIHVDVH